MLVKLQRPPPEIKIFFPGRSARSSRATRRPLLPASIAHIRPAAPAPRIRTSYFWGVGGIGHRKYTAPTAIVPATPLSATLRLAKATNTQNLFADWSIHRRYEVLSENNSCRGMSYW